MNIFQRAEEKIGKVSSIISQYGLSDTVSSIAKSVGNQLGIPGVNSYFGSSNGSVGGTWRDGARNAKSQFVTMSELINWFEPDQEHLWVIQFYDAPAPFNRFIPAVDVRLNLWALETLSKVGGNTTVLFPHENGPRTISITQYDDQNLTLLSWNEAWVNRAIFPALGCVAPLESIVKRVHLKKFTRDARITKEWKLLVYPTGTGDYAGNTGSGEARQFVVDYAIAGVFDGSGTGGRSSGGGGGLGGLASSLLSSFSSPNKSNPGQTPPINQAPPKTAPKSAFDASRM